jgi:hypothetical protein
VKKVDGMVMNVGNVDGSVKIVGVVIKVKKVVNGKVGMVICASCIGDGLSPSALLATGLTQRTATTPSAKPQTSTRLNLAFIVSSF